VKLILQGPGNVAAVFPTEYIRPATAEFVMLGIEPQMQGGAPA
jgi:hypothetical protein